MILTTAEELRALGLTLEVDETIASQIKTALFAVEARLKRAGYIARIRTPKMGWQTMTSPHRLYGDAYRVVAEVLVKAGTALSTMEESIPILLFNFSHDRMWNPTPSDLSQVKEFIHQAISEWREQSTKSIADKQREREIVRRRMLLEEYKSATGRPSNRKIYEAKNSGIYKPQFYDWRKGDLLETSSTTKNFERFLREKKPPTPRKPRN